jgi:hypothetical protein
VRRLLATLTVVVAACSSGPGPVSIPPPPPEIAFLQTPGGDYTILETRTGRVRASLPAGVLALGLNGSGDIAEGYLVTPAGPGGTAIARLVPERSFAIERLTTQDGVAAAAVLAGAPGLTSFVGPQTVLTILTTDGRLSGYQHGTLLWSDRATVGRQLAEVGDETLVLGTLGWQRVLVEAGSRGPVNAASTCLPGPLAVVTGRVVYDCGGRLSAGDLSVPGGRPAAFPAAGAEVLAFSNGQLWRIDGAGARRTGDTAAWTVPPVPSPDGSLLYVATASGVERVATASGGGRGLVKASGVASLALSRDGNYLYALSAGRLHTYASATGFEVGSVPASGQAILQIAGG